MTFVNNSEKFSNDPHRWAYQQNLWDYYSSTKFEYAVSHMIFYHPIYILKESQRNHGKGEDGGGGAKANRIYASSSWENYIYR